MPEVICDCCAREGVEGVGYADEMDFYEVCTECDVALRGAWDEMTPEQQAEARAEAVG